jgi:hypothetical protein
MFCLKFCDYPYYEIEEAHEKDYQADYKKEEVTDRHSIH